MYMQLKLEYYYVKISKLNTPVIVLAIIIKYNHTIIFEVSMIFCI